ncbi:hypothetical protein E0493_03610 [Roseomonas sp. M0104]|uniref:Uncharacterized protein n=1 Tax=Teichococcus coralli TaxID=2545983 RepID=A0A845B871_9PROT|nr:hypothetical protein [Pseudoroseomonas coralli]MXP62440.1 hypothetical protein [Pseudoroseomonas coralli]
MSTLLAPLWAIFAPLRAFIAQSPWRFVGLLALLGALAAVLEFHIITAFCAAILSLVLMWISEHRPKPAKRI